MVDYQSASSVIDLMARAAERHPDRLALWAMDETCTYRELLEQADQIATVLIRKGVKPGDRVAVLSTRSTLPYVAIVAALRAGCVHMPLNLRFPLERNLAILRRGKPTAIIVDDDGLQQLQPADFRALPSLRLLLAPASTRPAALPIECLGREEIRAVTRAAGWPESTRDSVCYLLFTSGSTGEPKGVPITHGSVLDYLDGISRLVEVGPEDRVSQLPELTFDLSVHDFCLAWTNGAALYSVPEKSSILAARFVEEHELTCWMSVPSTAGLMKQSGVLDDGAMPSLRMTFFCGEALATPTAQSWCRAAPNSVVYNVYGPTEATIAFSYFRFDPAANGLPAIVPIGRPLGRQKMAVFRPDGSRAAPGAVAELHLAGSQLTSGYWEAPALDQEKFVVIEDIRWYRTGDLARFDDALGFLFAGRADQQVKIGGFRVELQEIETVLRAAARGGLVAVIAWPLAADGNAGGCVAFIAGGKTDAGRLEAACRDQLPDYMVPSRYVFLGEMPLNSNGKVDYKRLSALVPP